MSSEVATQLRSFLESHSDSEEDLCALVDDFVLRCTSAEQPDTLLYELEEELQTIYRDDVDHGASEHMQIFLTVLNHLVPVLSSTSIISTWWDLVLRPALRSSKLPRTALAYATDLTLVALTRPDDTHPEKQKDFRRRIFDLYLLDAFNDSSGDDIIEWAELPVEERERRATWKSNLEDVLVKFGLDQPEALFAEVYYSFATPTARLQLIGLLNRYTSDPGFERHTGTLARHMLMNSVLTSLLADNSTTLCVLALTLLTKLLPLFAVNALLELKAMLPQLFAILSRILSWKERAQVSSEPPLDGVEGHDGDAGWEGSLGEAPEPVEGGRVLNTRPDLEWQRLEMSFQAPAPPPSAYRLFAILYYLFPCNLVSFLRHPAAYLLDCDLYCPYDAGWEDAIDAEQTKTKCQMLLLQHTAHPQMIWRDAEGELNEPPFFGDYDVARIVSECLMLGIHRPSSVFNHEGGAAAVQDSEKYDVVEDFSVKQQDAHRLHLSLQSMLNTSIALRSNLDIEIVDHTTVWPYDLFQSSSPRLPDIASSAASMKSSVESIDHDDVPSHIAQAISALQREILLLRNELNFESWLLRENVKQVSRLFESRIVSRHAEAERQGLHNKLREYKARTAQLEKLLKDQKKQGELMKAKYSEWYDGTQKKLKDLREEKRSWTAKTATLEQAEKEARTNFAAQGRLLAEAENRVFRLETMRKETQHKVDRLHDYERQIEQLTATQKLWDADVVKHKEQREIMKAVLSKYQKMVLRLESYEQQFSDAEEQMRTLRRKNQALEAKLTFAKIQTQNVRRDSDPRRRAEAQAEASRLAREKEEMRGINNELKEEIDELKAMVEVLRAQVSGQTGLLNDPTRSPILVGSPLIRQLRD